VEGDSLMKKPKDLLMLIAVLLVGVILGLQVKVVSAERSPKLIKCLTDCEDKYYNDAHNYGLGIALYKLDICRSRCFGDE
jgi:hypothetical protein